MADTNTRAAPPAHASNATSAKADTAHEELVNSSPTKVEKKKFPKRHVNEIWYPVEDEKAKQMERFFNDGTLKIKVDKKEVWKDYLDRGFSWSPKTPKDARRAETAWVKTDKMMVGMKGTIQAIEFPRDPDQFWRSA
ncbi:hypothetical protein DL770_001739 [Monosporascus sp. CRB-9-2]|nr:hypothetical protein DL770_001739 [Monosporascus sp. CRB-9-2]